VSRAAPTVIAQVLSHIRQVGRGSNTLCVGAFALTLVNFSALGGQPAGQQPAPVNPPALLAAPAPPAAAEAPKETPKPVAPPGAVATAPAPAPPAPAPKTESPAPAPAPAAAPRQTPPPPPDPNDEIERLKKAADLMVKVNEALGTPRSPYGKIIYDIAVRHSINPHLVAALIHVESAFNPRAVSSKGAYGLMQLLPETARRFGLRKKKDLFNPRKNLEAGVRYLKWLADRFGGDAEKILAAYNAGEGAVERFGGIPPYQETQGYVQRIFGLLGLTVPAAPTPAPQPAAPAAAGGEAAAR
jgi:soluble lytic murein transglycosylase-like protein